MDDNRESVAIVGLGYVGLSTAVCLASRGFDVTGLDTDLTKVRSLKKGVVQFHETGLAPLLKDGIAGGRLNFTSDNDEAFDDARMVFITVGTPGRRDGSIDLSQLRKASASIGKALRKKSEGTLVVVKSTVVPGTTQGVVRPLIEEYSDMRLGQFGLAVNPEFLREGSAISDTLSPDRIVIGAADSESGTRLKAWYGRFHGKEMPRVLLTSMVNAEMIKYASNAFLATKVSFINEIASLCKSVPGADVSIVSVGMGLDRRIGPHFLRAGLGYGGSCFPPSEEVLVCDSSGNLGIKQASEVYEELQAGSSLSAVTLNVDTGMVSVRPIMGVSKREYLGSIIRLTTKMGRSVQVTSDHPLLVRSGGEGNLHVKMAESVETGDYLPLFIGNPLQKKQLMRIDLLNEVAKSRLFEHDKVRARPTAGNLSAQAESIRTGIKKLYGRDSRRYRYRDLIRSNAMKLSEYLYLKENGFIHMESDDLLLFTSRGPTTHFPAVVYPDEDFWRLVGYYLSEGHIHVERNLRGARNRISFSFNQGELEYISDVSRILHNWGVKYRINRDRKNHSTSVTVSSRIFAFLLNDLLGCGTNSYNKAMPWSIFTQPTSFKFALLSGMIRGDGSAENRRDTPALIFSYATSSRMLGNQLSTLYHTLRLVPSKGVQMQKKATTESYHYKVSGYRQTERMIDLFGAEIATRQRQKLLLYGARREQAGFKESGHDYVLVKVKGKVEIPYSGEVFSFEVDGTHTIVMAGGIVVHNCLPKDVQALLAGARASHASLPIIEAVHERNKRQPLAAVEMAKKMLGGLEGRRVALLGLAFKPDTDDVREAGSMRLIHELLKSGCRVVAYDPVAIPNARRILGRAIAYASSVESCLRGADCCIVVTEWDEFKQLEPKDFSVMRNQALVDGRRIYDPTKFEAKMKFVAVGLGRALAGDR